MHLFFVTMLLITIVLTGIMIGIILQARPSKVQLSYMLFMMTVMVYQIGYYIELTTLIPEVALVGVKIEYLAECCLLVCIFIFLADFCKIKIPLYMRRIQVAFGVIFVFSIFTQEEYHLFYKDYGMFYNGSFMQFHSVPNTIFYFFYLNFAFVFLYATITCLAALRKSFGIQKRRITAVLIGNQIPILFIVLKILKLTGGFDIVPFGIFFGMLFYFYAIIRYGYFNSIQAANENAVNHSKEGIVVVNILNEILYSNEMMKNIIPNIAEGNLAKDYPLLLDILNNQEKEVRISEAVYEIRTENLLEYGFIQGRMIWFIDMTQHYNYLNQLKRLKEYAETANYEKSTFLAKMSHEIRTPMNAIMGMDEMILRETQSDLVREYAENIKTAGKTLMSLINDLLDLSKIEAGKMEIIPVEYELRSVLNDILNINFSKANDKNLSLEFEIDPETPNHLYGDEIRLRQIMINILNNAIKYTEKGKVSLSLSFIRKENKGVVLKFKIEDTGIGIKNEDLERLFDTFQRVDLVKNRTIEGSGLGLAITKQLVNLMGGTISVESVYGVGSVFTFTIEQKTINHEIIGTFLKKERGKNRVAKKYSPSFQAPDAKILLVDDSEMNLEVASGLLRHTLIQIDTASSGEQCLEMVQKNFYHLILIDHMMPGMDGIQTLDEFKKLQGNMCLGIPVIVFTANALTGVKDKYIAMGFQDYISKPIDAIQFERKIMEYLPQELVVKQEIADETNLEKQVILPEIKGLSVQTGLNFLKGDKDKYLGLLGTFYRYIAGNQDRLFALYQDRDLSNYAILAHGIKSAAQYVGAENLAKYAQNHEELGKQKAYQEIAYSIQDFLNEIQRLRSELQLFFDKINREKALEESSLGEISRDEILKIIDEIIEEEQWYQPEALNKRIENLLKNKLDGKVRELFRVSMESADDYEYAQVADALEKIKGLLSE